ncbi:hypothetical protein So717_33640 [Roseobacter cerasinus]|uniref:Nicotianamine synthase n=1 Tax=Roseobacter cerasinus TaxID=2602289 RepID=A0A640VWZ8_9RHOB|nr:nicotianamine synthase family protein [Roseobacter cerasinus]GFE51611.1 hypothetical protein So717_33640 [Roseobacter cerasinus]
MIASVQDRIPDLLPLMQVPKERAYATQLYRHYRAVFQQIEQATRQNLPLTLSDPHVSDLSARTQSMMLDLEWMFERLMQEYANAPDAFSAAEQGPLGEMTGFFRKIYRKVAREELRQLALSPKSRVCQVGAGPMPLSLAQYHRVTGAEIAGIDIAPTAVAQAQTFFARLGISGADVQLADGSVFDYAPYDVVLIAATAAPKEAILSRILATNSNPDLCIVNRDTGGWNALIYRPNPLPATDAITPDWAVTAQPITSTGYHRSGAGGLHA